MTCRFASLMVAMLLSLPAIAHQTQSSAHPAAVRPANRRGRSRSESEGELILREGYQSTVAVASRFTLQNDWSSHHATASSIGIGLGMHVMVVHLGPVALGVESAADFLFREGDMIVPLDVSLKAFFETHTYIEPFMGLGPVLSVNFGDETGVHYGAALSFGVALHATRLFGFLVEGTYRWLAGHAFQQQLAFSMGPCFSF